MNYKNDIYLLVGPSGSGKTYMENKMIKQNKHLIRLVSFTTREQREGEKHGIDYFFIDESEIKDLNILQQMEIYGNHYGTSVEHLNNNYNHVLVVGTDGPQQFKDIFGKDRVHTYFVYSPWYKRLYRLIKRDGFKKGLERFRLDIGRFKDFNKKNATIIKN